MLKKKNFETKKLLKELKNGTYNNKTGKKMTNIELGNIIGKNESTVRNYINKDKTPVISIEDIRELVKYFEEERQEWSLDKNAKDVLKQLKVISMTEPHSPNFFKEKEEENPEESQRSPKRQKTTTDPNKIYCNQIILDAGLIIANNFNENEEIEKILACIQSINKNLLSLGEIDKINYFDFQLNFYRPKSEDKRSEWDDYKKYCRLQADFIRTKIQDNFKINPEWNEVKLSPCPYNPRLRELTFEKLTPEELNELIPEESSSQDIEENEDKQQSSTSIPRR